MWCGGGFSPPHHRRPAVVGRVRAAVAAALSWANAEEHRHAMVIDSAVALANAVASPTDPWDRDTIATVASAVLGLITQIRTAGTRQRERRGPAAYDVATRHRSRQR